jgi:hypothetical protein
MFTDESTIFGGESLALSFVVGGGGVSQAQVCAYILGRAHGEYTEEDIRNAIVPAYYAACEPVGIDPVIPIAQMIHETGNLTSFWAARPQRNPAGIGVNGQKQSEPPADRANWAFNTQRSQWERGVSFASWQNDAIPAHVGRLLAYFLPKGAENDIQRAVIERGLRYRARYHARLGQHPAPARQSPQPHRSGLGLARQRLRRQDRGRREPHRGDQRVAFTTKTRRHEVRKKLRAFVVTSSVYSGERTPSTTVWPGVIHSPATGSVLTTA